MNTEMAIVNDAAQAFVSKSIGSTEVAAIKGWYKASLLRVMPEYEFAANVLLRKIKEAEGIGDYKQASYLTSLLQALPRYEVWQDSIYNLVTTVGKNDMLDKYLAGSAYTASVVMGLKGSGTAAAGDTQASHSGWSEVGGANAPAYSGNRPTPSFSAASGGVKQTSASVSFTFTSGGTVAGCFINLGGSATKDSTTGILFSAGDFSGGSKTVAASEVLNVSWSVTLT
jgi:hypothetical protein